MPNFKTFDRPWVYALGMMALAAGVVVAINPATSDFNANQFGIFNNSQVSLKSGANVTNLLVTSGITGQGSAAGSWTINAGSGGGGFTNLAQSTFWSNGVASGMPWSLLTSNGDLTVGGNFFSPNLGPAGYWLAIGPLGKIIPTNPPAANLLGSSNYWTGFNEFVGGFEVNGTGTNDFASPSIIEGITNAFAFADANGVLGPSLNGITLTNVAGTNIDLAGGANITLSTNGAKVTIASTLPSIITPPSGQDLMIFMSSSNATTWIDTADGTTIFEDFGWQVGGSYTRSGGFPQNSQAGSYIFGMAPAGITDDGWLNLWAYPTNFSSYSVFRWSSAAAANQIWTSNLWLQCSLIVGTNTSGVDRTNSLYGIGLTDSGGNLIGNTFGNGIGWFCRGDYSANWIAWAGTAAARHYYTSALPAFPSSATIVQLNIIGTTNACDFYTNGVYDGTISTNMPGGKALEPVVQISAVQNNGSASKNNFWIDAFKVHVK